MNKREFKRMSANCLAMYDRTKNMYWIDKIKVFAQEYESENDFRRYEGFLKIYYPDGSEFFYSDLSKAGDQFGISGKEIFYMAKNKQSLDDGTYFRLESMPPKNKTGVIIEYPNGCTKEFLSLVSASEAINVSIDMISKHRGTNKPMPNGAIASELFHEEI